MQSSDMSHNCTAQASTVIRQIGRTAYVCVTYAVLGAQLRNMWSHDWNTSCSPNLSAPATEQMRHSRGRIHMICSPNVPKTEQMRHGKGNIAQSEENAEHDVFSKCVGVAMKHICGPDCKNARSGHVPEHAFSGKDPCSFLK
jgi:hypothetical protein